MSTPSALHSKKTPCWGTPEQIVEIARELLGKFDVDPCSSLIFNQTVRADRIITAEQNGLTTCWKTGGTRMTDLLTPLEPLPADVRVFINPPGGLVKDFWTRLVQLVSSGDVSKAFWVGFSVEQLCTLVGATFAHPLDFSTCILRRRVAFTSEDPAKKTGSPSHGNYVTAIGVDRAEFDEKFSHLGKCVHGDLT